ncbi:hypothetical protein MMPV_005051 [Pyropia vietnamensis]
MAPAGGGDGGADGDVGGFDWDHDSPFSMDIHAGAPRPGNPPLSGDTRGVAEWAAVPITFRGVLSHLGPAFIVAVGFLDPGNLSTNVEAGSRFGYALLWVLVASNGLAILLQTLSARLGIASRTHLAEACRGEYPRGVNLGLWAAAEVAVIATDLTEVLGTAIGLNLLFRVPLLVGCVATFADTLLLLGVDGGEGEGGGRGGVGLRTVEMATFVLLGLLSSCFVAELFLEAPDWHAAAVGAVVPKLPPGALLVSTAMVGATVMPHNLYLQSALVIERLPVHASRPFIRAELAYALIDTTIALCGALLINASVLLVAVRFFDAGIVVTTLQQAYHLLATTDTVTVLGVPVASTLFGVALVASGQSSTLGGTLAGQYVMSGFLGLDGPLLIRRLATRCLALLPSIFVIGAAGDAGVYNLLLGCQVVLSLQLPFAVVPLLRAVGSRAIMGDAASPRWLVALGWTAASLLIGLNVALVVEALAGFLGSAARPVGVRVAVGVIAIPALVALLGFLGWLAFRQDTDIHTRYARASSVDASAPAPVGSDDEDDDLGDEPPPPRGVAVAAATTAAATASAAGREEGDRGGGSLPLTNGSGMPAANGAEAGGTV